MGNSRIKQRHSSLQGIHLVTLTQLLEAVNNSHIKQGHIRLRLRVINTTLNHLMEAENHQQVVPGGIVRPPPLLEAIYYNHQFSTDGLVSICHLTDAIHYNNQFSTDGVVSIRLLTTINLPYQLIQKYQVDHYRHSVDNLHRNQLVLVIPICKMICSLQKLLHIILLALGRPVQHFLMGLKIPRY